MGTSTQTGPLATGWTAPLRIEVILGSVREGRFGPVVTRWFLRQATGTGARVGLLDLAEPIPDFADRIAAADAVVVVTPEYNHSFPGPLKARIDELGAQWHTKVVGFVSYGGLSGGLRAVEALRVVFAELHAVTVRDTVSFHGAGQAFAPDGTPKEEAAAEAAAVLLNRLTWWARALRAGRGHQPYLG